MQKALAAGALALVSAATCLVLAPAASAAPDACTTVTLRTGGNEGVGTTANKSSTSSCNDLNLVYAHDAAGDGYDAYAGRLYHSSTGSWKTCDAGYIGVLDGSYAVDRYVLCTDVSDGTKFTVASKYDSGDSVKIVH
ncbi:hypothetical protein ACIP3D_32910 [Streptomyces longwoodensis]|uniref:hypothetical protein n=1 Tax=Streptomyces longwoodensis TaxID=68231 RepID=UPI00381E3853